MTDNLTETDQVDLAATTTAPERPVRRVGILAVTEEDLCNLARVEPGQRITGLMTDPMRQAVLIRVEGDGLPVCDQGVYPEFVDALRYRPPALVERVDVEGLPPAQQHAATLIVLAELIEHAGHLSRGDVQPALALNAHATWIGCDQIVRRHAPVGRAWCATCRNSDGAAPWPCPDYRNAALGAVVGLVNPDDE